MMYINKYEHISKFYEVCLPGFWLPFKRLFESNIDKGKQYRLIDLGCGTGDALEYLNEYILHYIGVDHSQGMLDIGKQKFKNYDFIQGDITNFVEPNSKKYDIVLSAADTVNHLLDKELWDRFFKTAFRLLEDDGILIFDVCTVNDHKNNWVNYVEIIENDNFTWIRKGEYDADSKIANTHNYFYSLAGDQNYYKKEYDLIRQISFEIEEIIQMLRRNNFTDISVYDLHTGLPVDFKTSVATFFCYIN
jgi:SAM-dependent methyltransferase